MASQEVSATSFNSKLCYRTMAIVMRKLYDRKCYGFQNLGFSMCSATKMTSIAHCFVVLSFDSLDILEKNCQMLPLHAGVDFSCHSRGFIGGCKRFSFDGYLSCTSTPSHCSQGQLDVTVRSTETRTSSGRTHSPIMNMHAIEAQIADYFQTPCIMNRQRLYRANLPPPS